MLRTLFKIFSALVVLTSFFASGLALVLLPAGMRMRRLLLSRNTSLHSRLLLTLLGIHVRTAYANRVSERNDGLMLVANHVSSLDILVLSAMTPCVFITSVELGSTAFLGVLARIGGSMFVERRKASGLRKELAAIGAAIKMGLPIAFFPEGTTSNGERVHAFKPALFAAALETGCDIQPICLQYTAIDGSPVTPENRDAVFYYGDTSFFTHLGRFLRTRRVDVDVRFLKKVHTTGIHDRRELASSAHKLISESYEQHRNAMQ
jgi:1-acyl-sn-glycerol-3-phosphate acyltransferase